MSLATLLVWLGMVSVANAQTANIDIPYTQDNAPLIIKAAALNYGADPSDLINTAYCESGFKNVPKHWDVNGYAYGNFQFHKQTFYANAKLMGLENPDITDPVQQVQVAAWMFSRGQQRQWSCYGDKTYQRLNET